MTRNSHEGTAALADPPRLRLGWFHRYPARFAPEALEEILSLVRRVLGCQPRRLLDPFAGTGGTLVAARMQGIDSVGVELSRLGTLVTAVRLNPPSDTGEAIEVVSDWAARRVPKAISTAPELTFWLGDPNSRQLTLFLRLLAGVRDQRLRAWLSVALSSSLRPASRWLPGSIKPQVDRHRVPPPLGSTLIRVATALARDCAIEADVGAAVTQVIRGDARRLPLAAGATDALVTSPPYGWTYDYVDVQRLTYLAFGWDQARASYIGRVAGISRDGSGFEPPARMHDWYWTDFRAEETSRGRALRSYIGDMRQHLREAWRVVAPGGCVAYTIANSFRRGREFDLVGMLGELLEEAGFRDVECHPRDASTRRILPLRRDVATGRFSSATGAVLAARESIITARRHG